MAMGRFRFPSRRTAWLAVLFLLGLGLGLAWFHPRVVYYRTVLWARLYYALNPPEEQVFRPAEATPHPLLATATTTPAMTSGPEPTRAVPATATPTRTWTPTPAWTPPALPPRAVLHLPRHEYQKWNNCGPANLSMVLAYWGWEGDQTVVAQGTKPNPRDKNVTPEDMRRFVERRLGYRLVWRPAGTLPLLKALLAARYPVLVEKGFYVPDVEGWMGHYLTLFGYEDGEGFFWAHDSYLGPSQRVPYEALERRWPDFNRVFLVVFPPYREAEVTNVLGPWMDETWAWEQARHRSQEEVERLEGVGRFFALFNWGEALVHLERYAEAASVFDWAFKEYAALPEDERPWRVLWYRDAPYRAYYHAGRYGDVVRLADFTLAAMSEPVLEEAYYWRGRAYAAMGNLAAARRDLEEALRLNPLYEEARNALQALEGAEG